MSYAGDSANHSYNLALLCHAYLGILYCKNHEYEKALDASRQIEALMQTNPTLFYDASVLNLNVRLYDVNKDDAALKETLAKLLTLVSSNMDFLEMSESYFDICDYLLEKEMPEALSSVLSYIQPNQAKLYSLEYVERLRQAKSDSELYREKSRIDQMTGLLNKYTIQFLVEEDLSKSSPDKQSALILVDLDHFKQINDTLGHLTGDSFICQTASVIQNYFKDNALCDLVGGIAFSSEYCYDYETLFSAADKALYRAKLEGRNKVIVAE